MAGGCDMNKGLKHICVTWIERISSSIYHQPQIQGEEATGRMLAQCAAWIQAPLSLPKTNWSQPGPTTQWTKWEENTHISRSRCGSEVIGWEGNVTDTERRRTGGPRWAHNWSNFCAYSTAYFPVVIPNPGKSSHIFAQNPPMAPGSSAGVKVLTRDHTFLCDQCTSPSSYSSKLTSYCLPLSHLLQPQGLPASPGTHWGAPSCGSPPCFVFWENISLWYFKSWHLHLLQILSKHPFLQGSSLIIH